jgi:starch-binding outer membrane protein, SusD/RagB family
MNKFLIYSGLSLVILATGCKKEYLDTKPTNAVTEQQIYATTSAITSALAGTYNSIYAYGANGTTGHDNFGQKAIDLAMDLAGADMIVHTAGYGWFNRDYQYAEWQLQDATNRRPDITWYFYYDIIKQVNKILAVIDAAGGTDAEKKSLKGQALGIRAYCYFSLVNCFQQTYKGNETKPGVPIYTKDAVNGAPRGTVKNVYDQIIADLTAAEGLLTGVVFSNKTYMSANVVQGFRARVALVMEDWATASTYAIKARTGYSPMPVTEYVKGFSLVSNPEWMWGSQISAAQATIYASFFSHIDVTNFGYAQLGTQKKITKELYDKINAADVRKALFKAPGTGTSTNPDYNQQKFRVPTAGSWAADYLYMRAAEMYLIEAEALFRQGQEGPARTALETLVKARYPAYSAASFTGTALLAEILLQRRIELWGEGFSLFDIKRLKTGLNRTRGAGNHGSPNFDPNVYTLPDADPKMIMRIPKREMDNNASLTAADQNP